jgi:hypothetical protein
MTDITAVVGSHGTTVLIATMPNTDINTVSEPSSTVIGITLNSLASMDATWIPTATGTPRLPVQGNSTVTTPLITNDGVTIGFGIPMLILTGIVGAWVALL